MAGCMESLIPEIIIDAILSTYITTDIAATAVAPPMDKSTIFRTKEKIEEAIFAKNSDEPLATNFTNCFAEIQPFTNLSSSLFLKNGQSAITVPKAILIQLVKAAARCRVLLEINNSSLSPGGYRGDTKANAADILNWCRRLDHPVVLSSDSHGTGQIGDFRYAYALIEETGFPRELVLNYSLDSFKKFIQMR